MAAMTGQEVRGRVDQVMPDHRPMGFDLPDHRRDHDLADIQQTLSKIHLRHRAFAGFHGSQNPVFFRDRVFRADHGAAPAGVA